MVVDILYPYFQMFLNFFVLMPPLIGMAKGLGYTYKETLVWNMLTRSSPMACFNGEGPATAGPLWIKCIIMIALSTVLLMINAQPAYSQEDIGKAYFLVIDKLSIYDIDPDATPELHKLTSEGGVGLASSRTLRGRNTLDTSLTIGAGNIGRVYGKGILAFNQDEYLDDRGQTAGHLYQNLTGINPGQASCLLVNLPEISNRIAEESVTTLPGAMGEVLRQNGFTVCLLGNGDTGTGKNRAAAVIAMDAKGQIPLGDIGSETVLSTIDSFLSRETNYYYLFEQVKRFESAADLLVVDLADLSRLETADTAFPDIALQEKQRRLKMIDVFVGQIAKRLDPSRDLLMVVSPSPASEQTRNKNNFTPVIAWGKGFTTGSLTSAATQRELVVANTDIAPTILQFFGLGDDTGTMIGRPIQVIPNDQGVLAEAQQLSTQTSTVNRLRVPLIKGYVLFQIIVILAAMAALFWMADLASLVKPAMVALVMVPLVYLPLNMIPLSTDWMYIALAIVLTLLITILVMKLTGSNAYKAFALTAALTVIALTADQITGSHLIQNSVLGYDPMAGARYYGIGNEYMGILLGSSIALAGSFYQKYSQRGWLPVIALFFIFQSIIIGSPQLGANSDGMITAPAAFLVTLLLLGNLRIRPRTILLVLAGVAVVAAGFTVYDMTRPVELQTHIGRAANQILMGGWGEAWTIITRKLAMNIKLIGSTIWSWVFMVMLLALALLVYRPVGAMKQLRQDKPYIVKSLGGIITAALVGLAINDSGIVAASTTSIYLVVPLLLLMLHYEAQRPANTEQ